MSFSDIQIKEQCGDRLGYRAQPQEGCYEISCLIYIPRSIRRPRLAFLHPFQTFSAAGWSSSLVIDGGTGADEMLAGVDGQTFVIDNAGDTIRFAALGNPIGNVDTYLSYQAPDFIRNITLLGSSDINGTGNTAVNTIRGNVGNNTLDGGAGNDTLIGGLGNDTFIVNASGDNVVENANEGVDEVRSSGTGNSLSNLIRGNDANNTLAGGSGIDILEGGVGNDVLSNTTQKSLLNGGAGADAAAARKSAGRLATTELKATVHGSPPREGFRQSPCSALMIFY